MLITISQSPKLRPQISPFVQPTLVWRPKQDQDFEGLGSSQYEDSSVSYWDKTKTKTKTESWARPV